MAPAKLEAEDGQKGARDRAPNLNPIEILALVKAYLEACDAQ